MNIKYKIPAKIESNKPATENSYSQLYSSTVDHKLADLWTDTFHVPPEMLLRREGEKVPTPSVLLGSIII